MTIIIEGHAKIPSKKNRMKFGKGQCYKDLGVKNFENYLGLIAKRAMIQQKKKLFEKPVRMTLSVTFGDRRRRDLQNSFGSICDALNGIVYQDDHLIHEIIASKHFSKKVWSFTILIEEMTEKN